MRAGAAANPTSRRQLRATWGRRPRALAGARPAASGRPGAMVARLWARAGAARLWATASATASGPIGRLIVLEIVAGRAN